MIILRKNVKRQKPATLPEYKSKSNHQLIAIGEPYAIFEGQEAPLIKAFSAGKYWKKQHGEFVVVGMSYDPEDEEELREALDSRREGEIFGRWFSKYVPDGEIGYAAFSTVKQIDLKEFESLRLAIKKGAEDENRQIATRNGQDFGRGREE